ncbi:MAG: hypothetical protein ACI9SJ_000843 [Flavobacteriaceae bacterium]|jgi:hypothetical protein|uniref:riboflavin synthase subunit beta n=1 Tax=Candidatus Marifrigoribacter sp. Uisw_064 TaxID=3230970 RepID=UPI003ADA203A
MGLLKTRKNKKYGYTPRYYNDNGEGNPYQIEHKFDKFRSTVGENQGLKGKFSNAIQELKTSESKGSSKTILIIVAVLLLFFLFIIDFDLSIFSFQM